MTNIKKVLSETQSNGKSACENIYDLIIPQQSAPDLGLVIEGRERDEALMAFNTIGRNELAVREFYDEHIFAVRNTVMENAK